MAGVLPCSSVSPAIRTSTAGLSEALKQAGGRISESKRQQCFRRSLVTAETAVATLLLVESLLLLKSFSRRAGPSELAAVASGGSDR